MAGDPGPHETENLLARFRSQQKNYHYADVLLVNTAGWCA